MSSSSSSSSAAAALQLLDRLWTHTKAFHAAHAKTLALLQTLSNLLTQRADILSLLRDAKAAATTSASSTLRLPPCFNPYLAPPPSSSSSSSSSSFPSPPADIAPRLVAAQTRAIEACFRDVVAGAAEMEAIAGGAASSSSSSSRMEALRRDAVAGVGAREAAAWAGRARLRERERERDGDDDDDDDDDDSTNARDDHDHDDKDGDEPVPVAIEVVAWIDELAAGYRREAAALGALARGIVLAGGEGEEDAAAAVDAVVARWRVLRWVDLLWEAEVADREAALRALKS